MNQSEYDERIEQLLSDIVDGRISDERWRAFVEQAERDPTLWRILGDLQREHRELREQLMSGTAVAERVELPAPHVTVTSDTVFSLRRLSGWAGWAVAAAVTLTWVLWPSAPNPADVSNGVTPVSSPRSPEQALLDYYQLGREGGRVVGELPERVLLDARPAEDGEGYDLLYLRQIVERVTVPELYELGGQTESGDPTLVRYEQPYGGAM